jgi:DNA-binding FadR family transcriptional regulator
MSTEQYQELMRNVRANKRRAARDAIAQYLAENKEERHG